MITAKEARKVTVDELWVDYRDSVVARSGIADDESMRSLKMTFFGGFFSCLCAIKGVADVLPEDEAADKLTGFMEEIRRFGGTMPDDRSFPCPGHTASPT
jgi:hypothetical protein